MPPKNSQTFSLATTSVLGRTTTHSEDVRWRSNGHVDPHLGTIAETTTSEVRKRLVEEATEKIKNDFDNTSDSIVTPMRCPIEKEISIICGDNLPNETRRFAY